MSASRHADLLDTLRRLYATEALPALEQAIRVIVQQEQVAAELASALLDYVEIEESRAPSSSPLRERSRAALRKAGL